MNEFGEPNMGNPSVRFDEGRERVGHWPLAFQSNRSCLLYVREKNRSEKSDHAFLGLLRFFTALPSVTSVGSCSTLSARASLIRT
jgi:hypothetical protein